MLTLTPRFVILLTLIIFLVLTVTPPFTGLTARAELWLCDCQCGCTGCRPSRERESQGTTQRTRRRAVVKDHRFFLCPSCRVFIIRRFSYPWLVAHAKHSTQQSVVLNHNKVWTANSSQCVWWHDFSPPLSINSFCGLTWRHRTLGLRPPWIRSILKPKFNFLNFKPFYQVVYLFAVSSNYLYIPQINIKPC